MGMKDLCACVGFLVNVIRFNFLKHSNCGIRVQDPRICNFHSLLLVAMFQFPVYVHLINQLLSKSVRKYSVITDPLLHPRFSD
jgi:hypothetical protein